MLQNTQTSYKNDDNTIEQSKEKFFDLVIKKHYKENPKKIDEKQKSKIVETIASAKSAEEAKTLHETLTATVGSQTSGGPQSLSESVNRKSNLSSMMPRRKDNVVTESMSFAERMRKLAGIN